MADAKLGPWVVDTFDEVEWRIYGPGDRDTRQLIAKLDSRSAARAIVDAHNRELAEQTERVKRLERLEAWLHSKGLHPDYQYRTTDGPRKGWYDEDVPPEGEGWMRNIHRGSEGWERFDYHEESYWMRLKGDIGG